MKTSTPSPFSLELAHINKRFGPVTALDDVGFSLGVNEVVGLVGDNGAGKSTLVKILSGVIPADSGTLRIRGREVDTRRFSVRTARDLGVETVHQERALGECQPLWRNVFVGRHRCNRLGFIDVAFEKRETEKILKEYLGLRGHGVSADAEVASLSGGERQGLAIGRAMYFDADVLILDEPTTALSLGEVDKVLRFVRTVKAAGKSVIFISHTMSHVHEICDRFVVLDRGRVTHDLPKDETALETLCGVLTGMGTWGPGRARS
jgi:simple sugar transport system ATP-binding protein